MNMRAAGFNRFGGPEVLEVMLFEKPEPGVGEVRVRVITAGVQPADCAVRRGWTPPGAELRLPAIPGNEFAGIVDRIGAGVTHFRAGDEVIGFRLLNAYAEYVTVSELQLVGKPKGMPWEEAGGFSASGQTAHTALEELRIAPGETLLINGAAGAVGTAAVQIAQAQGVKVIGTASPGNHAYLTSLGAIPVPYGEGMADHIRALFPEGVDAMLDAAGGDGLVIGTGLVHNRNRVGTIVAFDEAEVLGIIGIRSKRSAERLAALVKLYEAHKLRIHVRSVYPLDRAADAHREVELGHGRGKVVIRIGDVDEWLLRKNTAAADTPTPSR